MFASVVAALACAVSVPPSGADATMMSLSPGDGACSSFARASSSDLAARSFSSMLDATRSASSMLDARELFSPLDVDCSAAAPAPSPDWSALASRFDETGARCYVVAPGHTLTFARGRAGGNRHAASAGTIRAAPEVRLADAHPLPLFAPARLALAPSFVMAAARPPHLDTPPTPPGRRIDRPPRS